jgi:hypothetical protein
VRRRRWPFGDPQERQHSSQPSLGTTSACSTSVTADAVTYGIQTCTGSCAAGPSRVLVSRPPLPARGTSRGARPGARRDAGLMRQTIKSREARTPRSGVGPCKAVNPRRERRRRSEAGALPRARQAGGVRVLRSGSRPATSRASAAKIPSPPATRGRVSGGERGCENAGCPATRGAFSGGGPGCGTSACERAWRWRTASGCRGRSAPACRPRPGRPCACS